MREKEGVREAGHDADQAATKIQGAFLKKSYSQSAVKKKAGKKAGNNVEHTSNDKPHTLAATSNVEPKVSKAIGKAKVKKDGKAKHDESDAKKENGEEAEQKNKPHTLAATSSVEPKVSKAI